MRYYSILFCLMLMLMEAGANDFKPPSDLPTISMMKERAKAYWQRVSGVVDYLPLSGGTLSGEMVLNYSGARTIYQSGTDVFAIGLWDGVNARIESASRPLYLTSYANSISMGISGGNTLTVSGSNVGIGITSPENLLHLHGNAVARFTNSVTGISNSDGLYIGNESVSSNAFDFWNYEASDLRFGTNNAGRFWIKNNGNIGIGLSSPENLLHLHGNSVMRFTNPSTGNSNSDGLYIGNASVSSNAFDFWNYEASDLRFGTNNAGRFWIKNNGNIGIGLSSPENLLHLHGNSVMRFTNPSTGNSNSDGLYIGNATVGSTDFDVWNYEASDLRFGTNNLEQLRIKPDGNIGIGTSTPSEKLSINGNVKAKKVIVSQLGWPDYVFHPSYSLKSLREVENYILQHNHLPDIPSAKEVKENGINLGDNQALLLKKIEELTLYIIQQGKEIEMLKQKINK